MAPAGDGKTAAEDAQKTRKVTTACDTCRLKRQKCDGTQPQCTTCLENHLECTYSRQARRRGPPLGYLRHVEVRLHVNDAFMGYLLSEDPHLASDLLMRVQAFARPNPNLVEQTSRWDTWTAQWRDTEMAHILDNVSARFATPVSRPENESPLKTNTSTTLPPASVPSTSASTGPSRRATATSSTLKRSTSTASSDAKLFSPPPAAEASPTSASGGMDFSSYNLHPIHTGPDGLDLSGQHSNSSRPLPSAATQPSSNGFQLMSWSGDQLSQALSDLLGDTHPPQQQSPHTPFQTVSDPHFTPTLPHMLQSQSHTSAFETGSLGTGTGSNSGSPYRWFDPSADHNNAGSSNAKQAGMMFLTNPFLGGAAAAGNNLNSGSSPASVPSLGREGSPADDPENVIVATETDTVRYEGSATGMHHQALESSYTGSFWRSQPMYNMDDGSPSAPRSEPGGPQLSTSQLSSIHGVSSLHQSIELPPAHVQQHLAEIYLQDVHPVFPLLSRSSIISRAYKPRSLVLALCAYCACLSPELGSGSSDPSIPAGSSGAGVGDATKIAAEMWYEQARTMVMVQNVRRQTDIETIQTVLFLVLRDQGRGKESQAWLLMGLVVRMSIDLGLHLHSSAWVDIPEDVKNMRRRVWGVVCILDLLIALQLGRPSAIFDAHWASEIPQTPAPPPDVGRPQSLETPGTPTPQFFAYTASLCLIISRINYQLYLNTSPSDEENVRRLESLKHELDLWHEHLPSNLRISIGHQASLPVLDVNLLYHVAIILLYRPYRLHPTIPALRTSLDAAATFNVLLTYYRSVQRLKRSNPHIIYLIFTGAIAHLSGVRAMRVSSSPSTATALSSPIQPNVSSASTSITAQYNLLSCVEALKEISTSWPLAERCHRIMTGLMDAEGLWNAGPPESPITGTSSPYHGTMQPFGSQNQLHLQQLQQQGPGGYRRSRSVERSRGFGFTPLNAAADPPPVPPLPPNVSSDYSGTGPAQPEYPRTLRRMDSNASNGSGPEDEDGMASGSGPKRSRSTHRTHHPYLSRVLTSSSSSGSGNATRHPREMSSGSSGMMEPESPSAITAASLLSLASSGPNSANSSRAYLPSAPSNGSGSHGAGTPPSGGGGTNMGQIDFGQIQMTQQQHGQQQQQNQQNQQNPNQLTADPYLVDFDPFSATGWATLDQDPFQQPSFYINGP